MPMTEKAQRILEWREALTLLPDEAFFNLIFMYLGEIETPYNKQNLIERLGSFLRKEENKKNIISLLTDNDIKILAAVHAIKNADEKKLSDFFTGELPFPELYAHIQNLKDRLLLYSRKSKGSAKEIISINPMLEEELIPYLSIDIFLPPVKVQRAEIEMQKICITPLLLASFISFLLSNKNILKADFSFKKKAISDIEDAFGSPFVPIAKSLIDSFLSLNLFHIQDNSLEADTERLNLFAQMPQIAMAVYLCIGSSGRYSRRTLQKKAQTLINILYDIPKEGCTRLSLNHLATIEEQNQGEEEESFMDKMFSLHNAKSSTSENLEIKSCISLGLLLKAGYTDKNEEVYIVNDALLAEDSLSLKTLNIDAAFSATIMPGNSLNELLPLMQIMNLIHYDTVATFEITRKSLTRVFDKGQGPKDIIALLEKYSSYPISQNLLFSLEDWYASYSSATLYKGYVLKIEESKASLIEKNPILKPYIKEVLAKGLLLLNFSSDDVATEVLSKSGLDYIGNVKTHNAEQAAAGLPKIEIPSTKAPASSLPPPPTERGTKGEQEKFLNDKIDYLERITLSNEQYEALRERILRRIVVSTEQLSAKSVKVQTLEASGMDYSKKLHVAENALQTDSLLELEVKSYEKPLKGKPLSLSKKADDALLIIRLKPEEKDVSFSIGAISRIKKIDTPFIQ